LHFQYFVQISGRPGVARRRQDIIAQGRLHVVRHFLSGVK
jgi:hypothetical protein